MRRRPTAHLAALIAGLRSGWRRSPFPGTGDVLDLEDLGCTTPPRSVRAGCTASAPRPRRPRNTTCCGSETSRPSPTTRRWPSTSWESRARLYRARDTAVRSRTRTALTVSIKAIPVVFEAALCALLFVALRRSAGDDGRPLGGRRYWLNPAAIINASFGGYLDALFVLPAAGALMAATAGWPALAGGLIAASVLTKPQGIFIVPAVAMALWNSGESGARRAADRGRCGGGGLVSAAIVAPFVAAGAWWNMVHGVASQANEIYRVDGGLQLLVDSGALPVGGLRVAARPRRVGGVHGARRPHSVREGGGPRAALSARRRHDAGAGRHRLGSLDRPAGARPVPRRGGWRVFGACVRRARRAGPREPSVRGDAAAGASRRRRAGDLCPSSPASASFWRSA